MEAKLPWTENEIVRHYLEAKDPSGMIQILADLNGTTESRIKRILYNAGITPAKREDSKNARASRKVMLECNGISYTVEEVAKMHRLTVGTIRAKYKGRDRLVMDGHTYTVIGYHRRG